MQKKKEGKTLEYKDAKSILLPEDKAAGPDELSARVLKELAAELSGVFYIPLPTVF